MQQIFLSSSIPNYSELIIQTHDSDHEFNKIQQYICIKMSVKSRTNKSNQNKSTLLN